MKRLFFRVSAFLSGAAVLLMTGVARAAVDINNLRGTSGAGSKTINSQLEGYNSTLQTGLNFTFAIFTLVGVICVGAGLMAWYKASKREEDAPKSAKVGVLVGVVLTVLGIVIGFMANTVAA